MTTQLPPGELKKCPVCQLELNAVVDDLEARFPDSDTNPAGITHKAAGALTLFWYYEGILHEKGHPEALANYGITLKENQVPVSTLNGCSTCQEEQTWASQRTEYFFPGFATNLEGVQPTVLKFLCRVMYWIGILHELDHPVSLTDYAESVKTGDFSINLPTEE